MSACKVKNCLGCSAEPPTLSQAMIKKLGTSLCQLWEDQLDGQTLLGKKVEPIGKKPKKNKDNNDDKKDPDDEEHQSRDE